MTVGAPEGTPAAGGEARPVLERQKLSFELDGRNVAHPWLAVPVVNGHKIMSVTSLDVHADGESVPEVTLRLAAADMIDLFLGSEALDIGVDDETREALVSLGWTPPPGGEVPGA